MMPTAIAFERPYSDGSGIEFGVRFDPKGDQIPSVEIQCHESPCKIPLTELRWFIQALEETYCRIGEAP